MRPRFKAHTLGGIAVLALDYVIATVAWPLSPTDLPPPPVPLTRSLNWSLV